MALLHKHGEDCLLHEGAEVKEGENSTVIELRVAPEDMGKVIGKQGRIAKAIRTVVRAASVRENKKYVVEIIG